MQDYSVFQSGARPVLGGGKKGLWITAPAWPLIVLQAEIQSLRISAVCGLGQKAVRSRAGPGLPSQGRQAAWGNALARKG